MKIASQTSRQEKRSSSQSPIFASISTSLYKNYPVFHPALKTIKRSGRGSSYDSAIFRKNPVMAWAEETILFRDPSHPASQMRAHVGHHNIILPIGGWHVSRD